MSNQFLFADFLESPQRYSDTVQYWSQVWADVAGDRAADWIVPWFHETHPALRDGNPIFTAISRDHERAVRVIQHSPEQGGSALSFWTDWFGGDAHDPEAVPELVVDCLLTPAVESAVRVLLNSWIRQGVVEIQQAATEVTDYGRQLPTFVVPEVAAA